MPCYHKTFASIKPKLVSSEAIASNLQMSRMIVTPIDLGVSHRTYEDA